MKSSELGKDVIRKELPLIPKSPGVYRMLNHKDDILYVGKAKNLPNRLKSYVSEKNHIIRTERMLSQTFKLEIIKECASVGIQITKKRSHEKF